jgi:hypothetical protein
MKFLNLVATESLVGERLQPEQVIEQPIEETTNVQTRHQSADTSTWRPHIDGSSVLHQRYSRLGP